MRPAPLVFLLATGCGPVLNIADALHRCDAHLPHVVDDPEGTLHRVTVESDAHCNDGSPPAMAVEAATTTEHAGDWVVFLESGGSCASGDDCIARWCGGDPPYSARLMSSDFFPGLFSTDGMFGHRPANPFEGWNKVYLHYCSSDDWLGTRSQELVLRDGLPNISLWFQGDRVVGALLDELDAGAVSDDGLVALPPLTEASRIHFAGSSAGAVGLLHHVDAFSDRYGDADVRASFDGVFGVDHTLMDDHTASRATKVDENRWSDMYEDAWDARTDPDCSGVGCMDHFRMYRDAISTPFLVRDDTQDPSTLDLTQAYGLADDEAGTLLSRSMDKLAAADPGNSVLESSCGVHIVTESDDFVDMKVRDVSMADAARQMWAGGRVAEVDTWPGTLSTCP